MLRSTSLASWQQGGYICNCLHSDWSLATFHASNGKQRKWVICKVHGKSLTNNRMTRTTHYELPPLKHTSCTLPIPSFLCILLLFLFFTVCTNFMLRVNISHRRTPINRFWLSPALPTSPA